MAIEFSIVESDVLSGVKIKRHQFLKKAEGQSGLVMVQIHSVRYCPENFLLSMISFLNQMLMSFGVFMATISRGS